MKVKYKLTKHDEVIFDAQIETGEIDSHGDVIMPGAFSGVPEQPYIVKRHYTAEETKEILDKILNQPMAWSVGNLQYDTKTVWWHVTFIIPKEEITGDFTNNMPSQLLIRWIVL